MHHHFPPLASSHFVEEGLGTALSTQWRALGAGRGRTSATGRATVPLPPHPWLVASQPSSCQGIQFHAFVYGAGEGTTSLAPHPRLEAKVAPRLGWRMQASEWEDQKGYCSCPLCGELAMGYIPAVVVVVGEPQKQCLHSHPMLQDPAPRRLSEEAAFLLINLCAVSSQEFRILETTLPKENRCRCKSIKHILPGVNGEERSLSSSLPVYEISSG